MSSIDNGQQATTPEKRRPGRPPGAKNRVKDPPEPTPAPASVSPPSPDEVELLREAIANPGLDEIPESVATSELPDIPEIPEGGVGATAGSAGTSIGENPAIKTVSLDRPNPQSWTMFFPGKSMKVALLPYRKGPKDHPDFHFVHPELQPELRRHLRTAWAVLCSDASGDVFLWLVLDSDRSPYYLGYRRALATGDAFLRDHFFQFILSEDHKKLLDVKGRPWEPDDVHPVLPSRSLGKLLREALGDDKMILTRGHPVYKTLTAGKKLA